MRIFWFNLPIGNIGKKDVAFILKKKEKKEPGGISTQRKDQVKFSFNRKPCIRVDLIHVTLLQQSQ